jgi:hypothetical protein
LARWTPRASRHPCERHSQTLITPCGQYMLQRYAAVARLALASERRVPIPVAALILS